MVGISALRVDMAHCQSGLLRTKYVCLSSRSSNVAVVAVYETPGLATRFTGTSRAAAVTQSRTMSYGAYFAQMHVCLLPRQTCRPFIAKSQHRPIGGTLNEGTFIRIDVAQAAICSAEAVRAVRQSPLVRINKSATQRVRATAVYHCAND